MDLISSVSSTFTDIFHQMGTPIDDLSIMPIEEELQKEEAACAYYRDDYWYRELNTVYPYALNDNVRVVDNISKNRNSIVVRSLFNKQVYQVRNQESIEKWVLLS